VPKIIKIGQCFTELKKEQTWHVFIETAYNRSSWSVSRSTLAFRCEWHMWPSAFMVLH